MDFVGIFSATGPVATTIAVIDLLLKIMFLGIVPENRQPGSSYGWLLLILFIPLVGIPLFLLLGSSYLRGRRREIQAEVDQFLVEAFADWDTVPGGVDLSPGMRTLLEMNRRLTALPCTTGCNHGVYSDYGESLAAMTRAVSRAEQRIDVEFYAQSWDHETDAFFTALVAAADRGVEVRLLVDQLGSIKYWGFRKLRKRLDASPVRWHYMLSVNPFRGRFRRPDLRNHRKILVIDSERAFVGSQNLIERYYGSKRNARLGRDWHDVMLEISGDVVSELQMVFSADWYAESNQVEVESPVRQRSHQLGEGHDENVFQVVPSGPGFTTEPGMRMFIHLVSMATRHIRLVSPYFVPTEAMMEALVSASYRGVEVEVFVPERADQFLVNHAQRSYFRALLEADVRVLRYRVPHVLHSKLVLIDDEVAVIGSSNLDIRSFLLNFEVSVLTFGGDVVEELRDVIEEYRADSSVLELESWMQRPKVARYVDNVARLTSALQ